MILDLPAAFGDRNQIFERVGRNAVLVRIGAFDQKLAQLLLLRRVKLARTARLGAIEQAVQPLSIVALDGVAQRLPLHASGPRRRADGHPAERMGNAKHTAARPIVLLRPRKPQQRFLAAKILSHFCPAPHHAPQINHRLALYESRKNNLG